METKSAIVFTGGRDDREALAFAAQVAQHPAAKLHVIHVSWKTESSPDAQKRRVCRVLRKIYSWRRRKHFTSVCFLVEKVVETREREKVIQILAAGNNIQNIEQITGRFVSNLYKQNKQRLLVGA